MDGRGSECFTWKAARRRSREVGLVKESTRLTSSMKSREDEEEWPERRGLTSAKMAEPPLAGEDGGDTSCLEERRDGGIRANSGQNQRMLKEEKHTVSRSLYTFRGVFEMGLDSG
ncbi:unnamed protein product [Linum trigynum]|uniref:Uncharacterized protein n=1 Tax=Linum trigynum TaxID=586398 RepID=A0AAV2D3W4_9ROSI